jgi:hypothetical protein
MSAFALRHFERSEAQPRNPLQRPTDIRYPVSVFESPRPPLMPMHTLLYSVFFFVFPSGNKIRRARMWIRGIGCGYGESDVDTGNRMWIRGIGCGYGELDADTGFRICFPVSAANAGLRPPSFRAERSAAEKSPATTHLHKTPRIRFRFPVFSFVLKIYDCFWRFTIVSGDS